MGTYAAKPSDGAAWVTGASDGIGKAVALELAREGFTVYASARSKEKLNELSREFSGSGKIIPAPLDVTDRKACISCIERIQKEAGLVSLCVLNAGTFLPVHGKHLDFSEFDKTFDVNLSGVINGLIPVVRLMQESGRGQIAIVSSVAGYGGLPKNAAYGASKAALINLAESLKFDFDKINIKIQLVHPGFIDTPLTKKNDFPMPFLMSVEAAAKRTIAGLKSDRFEITYPRRFTFMMKFVNILPYRMYFWLVRRITG